MRTTDPSTILQWQLTRNGGGVRTPTQQFPGVFDAYILDTDSTNTTLAAGTCRVVIPAYEPNTAVGPCQYPGDVAPPNNTPCTVGFVAPQANSVQSVEARVLALLGWGGGGGTPVNELSPLLLIGA